MNLERIKIDDNIPKIRVIKKSIKEISKSYYSPRSQKIINLIKRLETKGSSFESAELNN